MLYTDKGTRRVFASLVAISAFAAVSTAGAQKMPMPTGWSAVNPHEDYVVGAEPGRRTDGDGWVLGTIKSKVAVPQQNAMLQQSIKADAYVGKRMRLTGYVKTADKNLGTAHMFIRVDGEGFAHTSDYMWERPIPANSEWTKYALVVDVPKNAIGITFGLALEGGGQAWVDDVTLEQVGNEVATTGRPGGMVAPEPVPTAKQKFDMVEAYRNAPLAPTNLDFELRAIAAR